MVLPGTLQCMEDLECNRVDHMNGICKCYCNVCSQRFLELLTIVHVKQFEPLTFPNPLCPRTTITEKHLKERDLCYKNRKNHVACIAFTRSANPSVLS